MITLFPRTTSRYTEYQRTVTIQNNENADLNDYQVCIEIPHSHLMYPKANPNGLIIAHEDEILPYWVETWKRPDGVIRIWTKVNLPANSTVTLSLYYGGTIKFGKHDGSRVFEFFEDFDSAYLFTTKWEITHGEPYIDSSQCLMTQYHVTELGCTVKAKNFLASPNTLYEASLNVRKLAVVDYSEFHFRLGNWMPDTFDIKVCHLGGKKVRAAVNLNDSVLKDESVDVDDYHGFFKFRMTWLNDSIRHFFRQPQHEDWVEVGSPCSSFNPTNDLPLYLSTYSNDANCDIKGAWDWVFVRKFTANEPTVTVDSEQSLLKNW